jgi:hypothetical protein
MPAPDVGTPAGSEPTRPKSEKPEGKKDFPGDKLPDPTPA